MPDSSNDDAEKSRRDPEAERSEKRQRTDPPSFSDPTSLVTFIIGKGDNETTFLIHKSTACEYSPVFRAAFNSEFIEGQTQTYRLEETTERAFKHIMRWLYSQRIVVQQLQDDFEGSAGGDDEVAIRENKSLVESWVLADKLGLVSFRNEALKTIFAISEKRWAIPTCTLKYIYKNTSPESPLRRFFVALCGLELSPDVIAGGSKDYPTDFLLDVFVFLTQLHKDPAHDGNEVMDVSDFLIKTDEE